MPDVIGTLFHKEIPYGGVKGDKGDTGATPNVSATASVNSSTGTPSVNVVKTGTVENPSFEFAFSNLKGEKGDPGSGVSDWGEIGGDITDQTDLMDELDKKVITLTKAQYEALPAADKLDLSKVYYVPDDESEYNTNELDDTVTASDKVWSSEKVSTELAKKTDNSVVGTVESGATASKAYAVGEHFIRDGAFCTAIAAIAQGAAFTLNTNYTVGTIADAIKNTIQSDAYNVNSTYAYTTGQKITIYKRGNICEIPFVPLKQLPFATTITLVSNVDDKYAPIVSPAKFSIIDSNNNGFLIVTFDENGDRSIKITSAIQSPSNVHNTGANNLMYLAKE